MPCPLVFIKQCYFSFASLKSNFVVVGHLPVPGTSGMRCCFVLHLLRLYLIFGGLRCCVSRMCFSWALWCIFLISVVRQPVSASLPRLMSGLRLFYSPWKACIWCSKFLLCYEKSKPKQKTNTRTETREQRWQQQRDIAHLQQSRVQTQRDFQNIKRKDIQIL